MMLFEGANDVDTNDEREQSAQTPRMLLYCFLNESGDVDILLRVYFRPENSPTLPKSDDVVALDTSSIVNVQWKDGWRQKPRIRGGMLKTEAEMNEKTRRRRQHLVLISENLADAKVETEKHPTLWRTPNIGEKKSGIL